MNKPTAIVLALSILVMWLGMAVDKFAKLAGLW